VRLYKHGTAAADLIKSVITLGDDEDEKLRQFAAKDIADMLQRVREIVCP
jgi:hypothetical protein